MMKHRSFDDHIKKQFEGYSPEVPSHIWENIVAKKERKKPAGWFLKNRGSLSALLLIGLTAAILYIMYDPSPPVQTAKQNADEEKINSSPASERSSIASTQPGKPVTSSSETVATPDPGLQQEAIQPPQPDVSEHVTLNKTSKPTRQSFNANNMVKITTAAASSGEQEQDILAMTTANYFLEPTYFSFSKISANEKDLQLKKTWIPLLPIPCPSPEADAAGNKRYVEAYAGPDLAMQSFSDTGSNTRYMQARKESTKPVLSYSAGLRYTRVFNNGMSIRTGLNYSQVNEKFTYHQGHVVQVVYIINASGDTTGSYTQTGTRYKTTLNKYRSFDIPLVIGYELGNGRLHANINAGAMINVYSWQKGSQLDTANNVVDISTGKEESPYHFKTNMGVGFVGSLSVYYKLNERFHLLAEPYYRYNFLPVSKPAMTLKQKYNTAGLRFGIRMDL